MKADEFKIINGSERCQLGLNSRIVIEFVSGSGCGDQSYWCEFTTTYRAYRQKGTVLEECGRITERSGTDGNSYRGEIDGKVIACDFLGACEVFTRIEKATKP